VLILIVWLRLTTCFKRTRHWWWWWRRRQRLGRWWITGNFGCYPD